MSLRAAASSMRDRCAPLLGSRCLGPLCVAQQSEQLALLLQARLPWGADHPYSAMLPMALLAAIVQKEPLLPGGTAAFAAAQLLPVIEAATHRVHLASTRGQQQRPFPHLCRELLVSADTPPIIAAAAPKSRSLYADYDVRCMHLEACCRADPCNGACAL